jgi:hypothetical protein
MSSNKAPLFKGNDYAFRSVRMKSYLRALVCGVWKAVESGYIAPSTPPNDIIAKKLCNDNSREVKESEQIISDLKSQLLEAE